MSDDLVVTLYVVLGLAVAFTFAAAVVMAPLIMPAIWLAGIGAALGALLASLVGYPGVGAAVGAALTFGVIIARWFIRDAHEQRQRKQRFQRANV